jgi:GT2 family glycosyltransferase
MLPGTDMAQPEISVVIPSHGRRLRLLWLLNALEEQTLEPDRFEVIVVHDYDDPLAVDALDAHPLARAGQLHSTRIEGVTGPAQKRNLGWRAARAPLVAFTDDDCRPDPDWLRSLLAAGAEDQDAILQGATRPEPLENAIFAAPHHRSQWVDPPNLFAQTCNIAYPRALLETIDGFDEALPSAAGEDTDLALRAKAAGAAHVGVPDAVVFHAVESFSLPQVIRMTYRWQHLPYVVRRHPALRRALVMGVFWRRTHLELLLALAGLATVRRRPVGLALAAPYLARALNSRGSRRRARLVSAVELPGRALIDLAEVATMVRGSVRHRSLML